LADGADLAPVEQAGEQVVRRAFSVSSLLIA
jgi:hypothetical protein